MRIKFTLAQKNLGNRSSTDIILAWKATFFMNLSKYPSVFLFHVYYLLYVYFSNIHIDMCVFLYYVSIHLVFNILAN